MRSTDRYNWRRQVMGGDMRAKSTASAEHGIERPDLRVAWLCGVVLFLEGYDIAAAGYAIPSLVEAWRLAPSAFTQALTAGNVGLLLGSIGAGLLGDQVGRKPMLISCVATFGAFSLLSAFVVSPLQLAGLRFLTGLGLGGGIPLAIALASDFARPVTQGRLVMLMSAGIPIGFTLGGLLASRLVPVFSWPAIFIVGGVLPFAIIPVLALWLPESVILRASTSRSNPVIALFKDRLASCTALLWAMNSLNLLANFLILLWTPSSLAQRIRIFCVIFGVAKNPDSILEIGKAHVGVELKGARDSFSRLLQSSGERIASRRNAQRGEDVWAFPERLFSP